MSRKLHFFNRCLQINDSKTSTTEYPKEVHLTLRVSDSTIMHRCSQRGRRGNGLKGLAPPYGQLTRCFSAVADILVLTILRSVSFMSAQQRLDSIRLD